MVKFLTNTSGTTYNCPNLEPMHLALYLAGEITQVKESIPSGNVSLKAQGRNLDVIGINLVPVHRLGGIVFEPKDKKDISPARG